ncbi:MAG: NAD-dependent epimerase/dehydratase family protein [Myxococcota bacterium]
MKLLVTGGAGFIGSHLVEACLARGDEVAVLDCFDPYYARACKERNLARVLAHPGFMGLHEIDIRDREGLRTVLDVHAPEAVVHLAALAGVRPSFDAPARYCEVNVTGTQILLEELARAGTARFVFASSSSVYGERPRGPFREDAEADRPLSPYGASKRAGELIGHAMHSAYGLAVTCLRIFTAYGPRQRPDLALHKFARLILQRKPIPIFGDGRAERDFTFVSDTVSGILLALEREEGYAIYNLGRGAPLRLEDAIRGLERALEMEAERSYLPPQPGDMPRTWASIEKARRELGYEPGVSYEEGIRSFVAWLRAEDDRSARPSGVVPG